MYILLLWFVFPLLSIAGYLASFYFHSTALFHVFGVLLAIQILPYIPTKIYLLGGYALAIYLYDPWYKTIYNVSALYLAWFLLGIMFEAVVSAAAVSSFYGLKFIKRIIGNKSNK